MGTPTKQIILKKPPSLVIKKKEKPKRSAGAEAMGPAAYADNPNQSLPFQPSGFHCDQCGGRRIVRGPPQFFDFHCPYCGQINHSKGFVSGTDMLCRACGNPVLIPVPPIRPVPAHLGGVSMAPSRMKFFCTYCGQKLSATYDMVGKPTTCPACKKKVTIPHPPKPEDNA